MLGFKNKQACLKQELSEFQTEYKYYDDYYSKSRYQDLKVNSLLQLTSEKVLKLLIQYNYNFEKGKVKLLANKFYNLFVYGIYNFKIYKFPA